MSNKVVVIGRNYTSRLGMIRAVGMAGYDVTVIKTNGLPETKDIDAFSKYVKKYLYAKEPNRDELISVLMTLKSDKGKVVIIPVDDYAASTIDDNIDLLKDSFLFPNINMEQGAINRLMDKDYQKRLARQAGLNVADGWVVNIKNHTYTLPSDIVYPVFPKPQISFKGNKRCMRKCDNETELRQVLDEVASQRDCPILIEQYIKIEKEYGVLGFCGQDRIETPGLVEKTLIGEGGHKGVTKVGIVTPLVKKGDLYERIQKFLKLINLTGLCDIDLYEHNGMIFFNELNLRFGAFGYSIICAGVNLPKLMVEYLFHNILSSTQNEIYPKTVCLSEKVNYDDYYNGFYGIKRYKQINEMTDKTFLKNEDDPMPYKVFMSQNFSYKRRVKIVIKKLIKHFR